jgi:hypothetical protein
MVCIAMNCIATARQLLLILGKTADGSVKVSSGSVTKVPCFIVFIAVKYN